MMTTEYSNALTVVREATAKYNATLTDYRARKIDDAVFLAAQVEYQAAGVVFDVAFNAEAARG